MKKFLAYFLALITVALVASYLFLEPEFISSRNGKTVLKTNSAFFYIPSIKPIKVYAFDPNDQKLNQIIEKDTQDTDSTFGIYVKNLNTKQQAVLNENEKFTAASLYKLYVMYTIFDKAKNGEIDINRSDVQDNLEAMITVSSNEASLYLVEHYTSWQEITDKMRALGLKDTDLTGEDLVTTPADVAKLLELIADGKAVDFDSSVKMLELLAKQTKRDLIPALLPEKTLIANKTGELDDVLHDAAVIGTERSDYIIVLMSKESASLDQTRQAMRKISEDVYNFFNGDPASFPKIL